MRAKDERGSGVDAAAHVGPAAAGELDPAEVATDCASYASASQQMIRRSRRATPRLSEHAADLAERLAEHAVAHAAGGVDDDSRRGAAAVAASAARCRAPPPGGARRRR